MHRLIIILFLGSSSLLFGQTTIVYQEAKTAKYYQEDQLEAAKEAKIETYKKVFPYISAILELKVTEKINRNDSLIILFEWKELEGNLEKIYQYHGKEFPDYKFLGLDNKEVKLSDLKGKPVFIDLWFTTCSPCIRKFPDLNKMAKKYKNEVHFLAITFDSSKQVKKLLKKHPLNFVHLVEAKPFLKEIGQQLYPKNVVLDATGSVVFISESFKPLDKNQMENVIKKSLETE